MPTAKGCQTKGWMATKPIAALEFRPSDWSDCLSIKLPAKGQLTWMGVDGTPGIRPLGLELVYGLIRNLRQQSAITVTVTWWPSKARPWTGLQDHQLRPFVLSLSAGFARKTPFFSPPASPGAPLSFVHLQGCRPTLFVLSHEREQTTLSPLSYGQQAPKISQQTANWD